MNASTHVTLEERAAVLVITVPQHFVVYTREPSGSLTRWGEAAGDLHNYPIVETLVGWPETTVHWHELEDGSAIGLAF